MKRSSKEDPVETDTHLSALAYVTGNIGEQDEVVTDTHEPTTFNVTASPEFGSGGVFELHRVNHKDISESEIPEWGRSALDDIALLKKHLLPPAVASEDKSEFEAFSPNSRLHVNEKGEIPDVYTLEESVWDSSLLLFSPQVPALILHSALGVVKCCK